MKDEENEHIHNLRDELRAERHMYHRRNWLRHNAMVPKGFLSYHVLSALNEKPMSGSELMEEISKNTGGNWKPSPGSIYPLLALLQDRGYVKELPTENGMKRYELTESGKSLLDEQKSIMKKFKETMGFPRPHLRHLFMKMPPEKSAEIRDTMKRAGKAMIALSSALQENFSGQAVNEAIAAINEASGKLEEITRKLEGEQK
jgi:DNA-binding PadR family transcriptional regulator